VSALFCELNEGKFHGKELGSVTRSYELTFIVKPDVDATNLTILLEKVKDIITSEGGSIVKLDQWGLRRLMYPIRKYREGHYIFELLQLEGSSIARIENRLRLTEDIIRYLLIRADENAPVAVGEPVAEATAAVEPQAEPAPPAPVVESSPDAIAQ
jgi:small subunit ribosomal protein S6